MQKNKEYCIIDGKIVSRDEAFSGGLIYGLELLLSLKIWFGFGGIPFFKENYELLDYTASQLKITYPSELKNLKEHFRIVKRMLNKNKFYQSGHILLHLVHVGGETHYIVSSNPLKGFTFTTGDENLLVSFSALRKYSKNMPGKYAYFNNVMWNLAKAEIADSEYKQAILLNETNDICEGIGSNIFLISGNELLTPSLSTGCYEDILRKYIIESAEKIGFNVKEINSAGIDSLAEMDEVFFASEAYGLQWVLGIQNKRYIRFKTQNIYSALNLMLQSKAAIPI